MVRAFYVVKLNRSGRNWLIRENNRHFPGFFCLEK